MLGHNVRSMYLAMTLHASYICRSSCVVCVLVAVAALALAGAARAETWRDLTVAPEERCAVYDRQRDYRYPPSIEHEIVRRLGAVYGPYTGTCFASTSETDIEHIVATSEAHDSGLCAPRPRDTRPVRHGHSQPHPCRAACEPPLEERQGRLGVAPDAQPVLVRGPRRGGSARLRPHHRPARGRRFGTDPRRLREYRRWSQWSATRLPHTSEAQAQVSAATATRSRGTTDNRNGRITWQGGTSSRHRARSARSPGVPLHARRRWRRYRVRVSAPVSAEAGIRHRPFVPAVSFHIEFDRPGTSH